MKCKAKNYSFKDWNVKLKMINMHQLWIKIEGINYSLGGLKITSVIKNMSTTDEGFTVLLLLTSHEIYKSKVCEE